jgi:hypothetical protein
MDLPGDELLDVLGAEIGHADLGDGDRSERIAAAQKWIDERRSSLCAALQSSAVATQILDSDNEGTVEAALLIFNELTRSDVPVSPVLAVIIVRRVLGRLCPP